MYQKDPVCTLQKEYNHCPYFDGSQYCTNPKTSCRMLHTQENHKKYVREKRWYEKYYKNLR